MKNMIKSMAIGLATVAALASASTASAQIYAPGVFFLSHATGGSRSGAIQNAYYSALNSCASHQFTIQTSSATQSIRGSYWSCLLYTSDAADE